MSKRNKNSKISRREFIKQSAYLTGGGALTVFLGSSFGMNGIDNRNINPKKRTILCMGTLVSIIIYDDHDLDYTKIFDTAFNEFYLVEKLMSSHDPGSELSKVNQNAGQKSITVNPMLSEVLTKAKNFNDISNGSFDITILPMLKKYGFRDNNYKEPSHAELAEALSKLGSEKIELAAETNEVLLTQRGMEIDLGGIAKGYAVDRAVNVLKAKGVKQALINAGGDIYALGAPDGKSGWTIGIKDPINHDRIITKICIKDQALATSGNYERYVPVNGRNYGHLINPETGHSCENILSSTVVSSSAMEADALSTAVFPKEAKQGISFIDKNENTGCLLMSKKNEGGVDFRFSDSFPQNSYEIES